MTVGVALIALVLAAGGEHAAGRVVDRPLDNFPKEAKLPVLEMLFPHVGDGDVKDPSNTVIEEDFEAAAEVLLQGPVLASSEEEIDRDHSKK